MVVIDTEIIEAPSKEMADRQAKTKHSGARAVFVQTITRATPRRYGKYRVTTHY